MVRPVRSTISASRSQAGRPSRAPSNRPTVDLPVPLNPVRKIGRTMSPYNVRERSFAALRMTKISSAFPGLAEQCEKIQSLSQSIKYLGYSPNAFRTN